MPQTKISQKFSELAKCSPKAPLNSDLHIFFLVSICCFLSHFDLSKCLSFLVWMFISMVESKVRVMVRFKNSICKFNFHPWVTKHGINQSESKVPCICSFNFSFYNSFEGSFFISMVEFLLQFEVVKCLFKVAFELSMLYFRLNFDVQVPFTLTCLSSFQR